jgi:regulator of replication initiation timing
MKLFKNYKKLYETTKKSLTQAFEAIGELDAKLHEALDENQKLLLEKKLLENQVTNLKFECVSKKTGKKETKKAEKTTVKKVGRPKKGTK